MYETRVEHEQQLHFIVPVWTPNRDESCVIDRSNDCYAAW